MQGFQVRALTPESAVLVRPKRFSTGLFFVLGVLYLSWYFAKRDDAVLLQVEGDRVIEDRTDRFESLSYFLLEILVTLVIVLVLAAVLSTASGA